MLSDKEKQDIENELEVTLNKCLYNTEWLVGGDDGKEEAILNYIVELIQDRVDSLNKEKNYDIRRTSIRI